MVSLHQVIVLEGNLMTQKNLINGMPPTSISRGGKPDKSMGHVNGMPPPSNSVGGQPD